MNFKQYLSEKCRKVIEGWECNPEIYAISFFVYANEDYCYKGNTYFPEFSVGYNTEKDCDYAPSGSEDRWDFALWSQNNEVVINCETEKEADYLLEWYKENGIEATGPEDENEMYNEEMEYIGKGPVGYYELLMLVSDIAKELQDDGTVKNKYGNIPIIVHELEYTWCVKKATQNANPNGEAEDYLCYLTNEIGL